MLRSLLDLFRSTPRPALVDDETRTNLRRVADALRKDHSIVVVLPGTSVSFIATGLTEAAAHAQLPVEREKYADLMREYSVPSTYVPIVLPTAEADRINQRVKAQVEAAHTPRTPLTDGEWEELLRDSRQRDDERLARIEDPEERRLFLLARGLTDETADTKEDANENAA